MHPSKEVAIEIMSGFGYDLEARDGNDLHFFHNDHLLELVWDISETTISEMCQTMEEHAFSRGSQDGQAALQKQICTMIGVDQYFRAKTT